MSLCSKKWNLIILSGLLLIFILKNTVHNIDLEYFSNLRNGTPPKVVESGSKDNKNFKNCHTSTRKYENAKEIASSIRSGTLQPCKEGNLTGPLAVNKNPVEEDWLYENELQFVKQGGWWDPTSCKKTHQTAIIIPFRDRHEHLLIFLRHMHPILRRQQIHYRIFVIEQVDQYTFNRGKLMNVGYREAQKYFPYSCFVFHDVDVIPEDDRINYACSQSPAHLSVAIDKFKYKLTYEEIFGGIEMFTKDDYQKVNGFSNLFWNWCCEDDNLHFRLIRNGMKIHRQSIEIARYTMLKHDDNKKKKGRLSLPDRRQILYKSKEYIRQDGLNNLQYEVISTESKQLYTIIKVNLKKDKDKTIKDFQENKSRL